MKESNMFHQEKQLKDGKAIIEGLLFDKSECDLIHTFSNSYQDHLTQDELTGDYELYKTVNDRWALVRDGMVTIITSMDAQSLLEKEEEYNIYANHFDLQPA
jgi:hypothetical protein